ncbi:hypothetical protein GAYE_PCTG50G1219 [Galdieria yellowstonensis]|uniref:Peptidase S26 domain-containing protein n=1 Tax=Galdieria yellowstonensis TaxID=3028027 RepID=A0AAV9I805_9RHOD|nr:hypothetical protein GAYE_PCTG50G1219 [Galdieria yellowstonensis]
MSSKATWKTVSEKLLWIVKYGCTFYVVQKYGIEASMCVGPSMEPTLNAKGDIVVLEHISTRWGTLKPGDVVVAKSPSSPHSYICKRVKVVGDKPFSSRFWKYRQRTPGYVPRGYVCTVSNFFICSKIIRDIPRKQDEFITC